MRILIASDAWEPQINGVVRTLRTTRDLLVARGHEVRMITPQGRRTIACPSYPEIRLALWPGRSVAAAIDSFEPDAIHIATEGPLGLAARRACIARDLPFTTSFHTRFPEYIQARWGLPAGVGYAWLRRFHGRAARTFVATPTYRRELEARGFDRIALWSRGVDTVTFSRGERGLLEDAPRPVWMAVGRVAVEKNLRAFLDLDLPGSKWVVGDGPQLEELRAAYPSVRFAGAQTTALPDFYRAADVLVFPSRTDTFGLVLIEAMACGTPVAAYPVAGPLDIVGASAAGALDEDLGRACRRALLLRREDAHALAQSYSWASATDQFLRNLEPITRRYERAQMVGET